MKPYQSKTPVPDLMGAWLDEVLGSSTQEDRAARQTKASQVVERERPGMERMRDPFMPVARGEPAARAKEKVLWEDAQVMVLVDTFWSSPKVLVIPKTPCIFPTDASPALMDDMARVCAAVSDAFMEVAGAKPARIWINPPAGITVKQLHVHVMPHLPGRVEDGTGMYQKVSQQLAQTLGPSIPPA